jgi:hypothetical protein
VNKLFTRGWIEFLAVFLGLALSFNIEEWREERQISDKLFGDYQSIQLDIENDIPYLKRIISEHEEASKNSKQSIKILDGDISFNYKKFMIIRKNAHGSNSFFGIKSAYEASVSSGRLTYFGTDSLSNQIGKIYNHHYDRLKLNGELIDENWGKIEKLIYGKKESEPAIKEQNLIIIKSHKFYTSVTNHISFQNAYIRRSKRALKQMEKVNLLLLNKLKNNQ